MTENEGKSKGAQFEHVRPSKGGPDDKPLTARDILALSAEHVRLELIRKLGDGPATLQRPTAAQNEVESLYHAVEIVGISLPSVEHYIYKNRELSPGAGGKGIDSYLKVLTPVPTFAMPGSAADEKKEPGIISKLFALLLGGSKKEPAQ